MDRLDIRILRELAQSHTLWPARPGLVSSYRSMARQLGVSPGTVRNRIREMVRTGFLQGISVYANPNLLGLRSGSYAVEVSPALARSEVLRRVAQVQGVVFLENFLGTLLGVGLTYEDDRTLEEKLTRIDRIARSARGVFSRVEHPPSAVTLNASEWALVVRLMQGSFASYHQLAQESRVPVRTLKRRVAKLLRANAILTFPRTDYRALTGGVSTDLLVAFTDRHAKAAAGSRILHLVEDWMTFAGVWEEFDVYRLILPNVAKASDLAEAIRRIETVRSVRVEFVVGLIDHLDALRPYVERRMAVPRPRPRPTVAV